MKNFLLLLLISVAGIKSGFSQAAQTQARQVITLRLMPVHVIELPAPAAQSKNDQSAGYHASHTAHSNWFINKQLLVANNKHSFPFPKADESNQQTIRASNPSVKAFHLVYTITTL